MGDGSRDERDVANLRREIGREQIHVLDEVLPGPREPLHTRSNAELAFRPDLPDYTGDACGYGAKAIDDAIERRADAQELALERLAVHVHGHLAREITGRDVLEGSRGFDARKCHRLDERVDGANCSRPCTTGRAEGGTLGELPLTTDVARHPVELHDQRCVRIEERVERERDFSQDPVGGLGGGKPHGEITLSRRAECISERAQPVVDWRGVAIAVRRAPVVASAATT
jgi:hypothetical protein